MPMIIIEDLELEKVWYFQIEGSSNWQFEIGYRGNGFNEQGSLYVNANNCDERYLSWTKTLNKGEKFTPYPVAYGCCKGGFEEAVMQLIKYKRTYLRPGVPGDIYPLVFNDYMNCLWAQPTKEKLIPLIDKASEVGCEYFCIDAGWHGVLDPPHSYSTRLGDWEPSPDRFGKEGLQGILDYIKSKNMLPGLWLEIEVCGQDSKLFQKPDDWFLLRNGNRIGGGARVFFNFANFNVREYFHGIFENLYNMGVRFIKNDYNDCIGLGVENIGTSAPDGLMQHTMAFYSFIDEIREKYPDLVIENCASGGMRQDAGILSHFHIQSTSDQEIYYKYPSIASGLLAAILPEQAGIWAYPYPILFDEINNPGILDTKEYSLKMANGEQTIFNMVTGMLGNLYMSGMINKSDENNTKLIKEGVCVYKENRDFIHTSYPLWPEGFLSINDESRWYSFILTNENKSEMLLFVWRFDSIEDDYKVDIGKYGSFNEIKRLYHEIFR